MKVYDVYLQGGRIVTVHSVCDFGEILTALLGGERDEWAHFTKPRRTAIRKDNVIGVMDVSKERVPGAVDPKGLNKPYRPWKEEK